MEQEGIAVLDGILIAAEVRQAVIEKMREVTAGLCARDGPVEVLEAAEVAFLVTGLLPEARRDQRQHLAGGRILVMGMHRRRRGVEAVWNRFAVVVVVVELAAGGFAAFHQQVGVTALLAIEVLHAQLLAALGPAGEGCRRGEEACVLEDFPAHAAGLAPRQEVVQQPPLAGAGHQHAITLIQGSQTLCFAGQTLEVVRILQSAFMYLPATLPEFLGVMAHRGQHHRDLVRVVRHVAAFLLDLAEGDHAVGGRLLEACQLMAELVAEDQHQWPREVVTSGKLQSGGFGHDDSGRVVTIIVLKLYKS